MRMPTPSQHLPFSPCGHCVTAAGRARTRLNVPSSRDGGLADWTANELCRDLLRAWRAAGGRGRRFLPPGCHLRRWKNFLVPASPAFSHLSLLLPGCLACLFPASRLPVRLWRRYARFSFDLPRLHSPFSRGFLWTLRCGRDSALGASSCYFPAWHLFCISALAASCACLLCWRVAVMGCGDVRVNGMLAQRDWR